MANTKIEWTDKSWNPITGCSAVSEGCRHCYAKRMANRLKGRYGYPKHDPFRVMFHPDRLDEPLHWKKPCRIFVCSMGDLFHDDVDGEWLKDIFSIIRACPHHTFLLLTKRPQNVNKRYFDYFGHTSYSHVWLGVSISNQVDADKNLPVLLQIPAAKRFVSVEPMLGNILFYPSWFFPYPEHLGEIKHSGLDWVLCGGETGPGARPLHPDWVRSLRDQSQAAGVPFFFKGWGEWSPWNDYRTAGIFLRPNGSWGCQGESWDGNAQAMERVGHKHSGHLLDGKEYRQFPEGGPHAKYRILRYRRYRIPWWKRVNWDVVRDWVCWLLLVGAIVAFGSVILFGSFLRQVFG